MQRFIQIRITVAYTLEDYHGADVHAMEYGRARYAGAGLLTARYWTGTIS